VPIRDIRLQAAILRAGQLLLVRCRLPTGETFWLLPGGAREAGESLEVALAREVREELAVEVAVRDLLDDVPADPPDGTYARWRTYRCTLTRGEPVAQGRDGVALLEAVMWLPLGEETCWPTSVREDPFLAPQLLRLAARVG
jgi:8-oxo-dGTP diphosphatase